VLKGLLASVRMEGESVALAAWRGHMWQGHVAMAQARDRNWPLLTTPVQHAVSKRGDAVHIWGGSGRVSREKEEAHEYLVLAASVHITAVCRAC